MLQRPPIETIPDTPGSYQFMDKKGNIIYVGKAKSLKKRVASYFRDSKKMHPRTVQMLSQAESVEWVSLKSEVESLMLEYNLIQRHQPRFNVKYRDDKSYPYLAVTLNDEWPRPMVIRGRHKKGNRYFGPYAHAYAIRETLDLLLRTFPLRTCSDSKYKIHERLGKPCLLFHIEKCSGPCAEEISKAKYSKLVEELLSFLEGNTEPTIQRLEKEMSRYVDGLNFEMAARIRDKLASIQKAVEAQQMVGNRLEDFDIIGWADYELESAVQVFFVRRGRVMGRRGFILDKAEPLTLGEMAGRVLEGIYFEKNPLGPPKRVYIPKLPENIQMYEKWLSDLRQSPVTIQIPQRGEKRRLAETVAQNAEESLLRHSLKRSQDHNSRSRALEELREYLDLEDAPLRIECYDTSHTSGVDYTGSMVVAEDGLAKKQDYRHFILKDVQKNDDYSAMYELLKRRFDGYRQKKSGSFSYSPGLVLVDGGKGQLAVAKKVLEEFDLDKQIPVAALAKEMEEVYIPGKKQSIRIPRQSEALYLLQRIRDESHRFAVLHHRKRRSSRMKKSFLDGIAGLGPARKQRLIKEFGNVEKVKGADLETLKSLSWLPEPVAEALIEKADKK